ncbi:HNH endonuclease [Amycolatopsis sp. WGS_07]|uniref:HNH endonuclease n=1 Tax=Amycolatopsis sp. WGS_07 TaxID=3076764 RepID=UPI0038733680
MAAGKRNPNWTRDEATLACALVVENGWRELRADDAKVVELSKLLQRLPFYPPEVRAETFRNPNGVARKTVDLTTRRPGYKGGQTKGGKVDIDVISDFLSDEPGMLARAKAITEAVELYPEVHHPAQPDLDLDGDLSAEEGGILARVHLIRERDPKLRKKKIDQARKEHGRVACEACDFDFEKTYGTRGRNFAECHHRTPLSESGPTKTELKHLAVLCSNCHRMIHRTKPWLTVEELQDLVRRDS